LAFLQAKISYRGALPSYSSLNGIPLPPLIGFLLPLLVGIPVAIEKIKLFTSACY